MKIIHYYTGRQVSDEESVRARAVRLEGHSYHFIDARVWDGITETGDKIVSDRDEIVAAYAAVGIGQFDSSPWEPNKPAPVVEEPATEQPAVNEKPRRGRPKKVEKPEVVEPVKAEEVQK